MNKIEKELKLIENTDKILNMMKDLISVNFTLITRIEALEKEIKKGQKK